MVLDKKALNLELLEFAGFTCTGGIWTYPDGVDVDNGVPFFPGSLDEIFKWLVPELKRKLRYERNDWKYYEFMHGWFLDFFFNKREPALAFCLAVRGLKEGK